jgi:hypothetical protein
LQAWGKGSTRFGDGVVEMGVWRQRKSEYRKRRKKARIKVFF